MWSFAMVNNRLAEVYFDRKGRGVHFWGHCFVDRDDFKTKKEQKEIEMDTRRVILSYKGGKYFKVLMKE
jgi:hypothetical protein